MSPLQYLSKTFTSKVTLPNIRKGLVKVTFASHLQYLNGSLSKSLRSLKVYFHAVYVFVHTRMGRQKEINEQHNFLSTAIYLLSLSTFRHLRWKEGGTYRATSADVSLRTQYC